MPHDVIMPALGMAQDTGLIVAWRKAEGDAVAIGDVLMEVETDKAVMEVEAQAGGFLTDIRAGEGEAVPVGNTVAVISETRDAVAQPATSSSAEQAARDTAPTDAKPVIMPALGMAQDTGLIVAWRKAPGDAVTAGDVLLEVETDKSVMEVEAGHDGFIAELRGDAGDNVPVGEVIAIISAEKPETPVKRPKPDNVPAAAESRTPAAPAPKQFAPSTAKTASRRDVQASGGRILASPKAKRLAAERGLNLSRLAAEGRKQPYHVADLEHLAALPAQTAATGAIAAFDHVEACVPKSGYADFCAWFAVETGDRADNLAVWAAFAAASLRSATGRDGETIVTEMRNPLGSRSAHFEDPDRFSLSGMKPLDEATPPAIIVNDLTGSRITAVRFGTASVPALTVSEQDDAYTIVLEAPSGALNPHQAISLVNEMAARLDEPLRHLL